MEVVTETLAEDFIWKPNPRQSEFLELPDEVFEGLYGGAVFGGKSEVLLKYPIIKGWTANGRFKGILFRRSYPELEASLIKRTLDPKDGYAKFGAKWNDNKHIWTFPSGSWIKLAFIENDKDARSYDTAEFNYIGFDQLEHFTEWQYTYMISRCRSNSSLPSVMRSAANPGGPGTAWVRERFVRPCPQGGKILRDKVTGTLRIFIPAKLDDNIEGLKNDPQYKNRMLLLPEAERKAKLDGDWFALIGQAFPEFRMKQFPSEAENALHICDPFTIPEWWPRIAAIDWGYAAKTAILLGAISPDDRLYIFREYGVRKTRISQWSADYLKIVQGQNIKTVYLDPSAWQHRGDPMTIQEQFTHHTGIIPERADNDREGGKLLLHDLMRWTPKPVLMQREDSFQAEWYSDLISRGMNKEARDYYHSFLPKGLESVESLPKLQIFSTCTQLIETIPLCQLKKDTEEVEDFDGDDFYDCLRYLSKAYHQFLSESSSQSDKRKMTDKIWSKFEIDKDHFSLNMQLEKQESRIKKQPFGIRLFH